MKEKVLEYENLYKIDGFYFVNEDEEAYQQALLRQKKLKEEKELRNKVNELEKKMDLILELLQRRD